MKLKVDEVKNSKHLRRVGWYKVRSYIDVTKTKQNLLDCDNLLLQQELFYFFS